MLLGILDELLDVFEPRLGLYIVFHESVVGVVFDAVHALCPLSSFDEWMSGGCGWGYYHVLMPRPDFEMGPCLREVVALAPGRIGAHWFDMHRELGWSEGVL